METLEDFIKAKAIAFSTGELDEAFKSIVMPTTVYVGEKTLFIETQEQLVGLIRMSRDALLKFDYDHSGIEIVEKTPLKSNGSRIDVCWRHFDKSGGIISEQGTTYYCIGVNGVWQVSLAEIEDTDDSPELDALTLQ